MRREQGSILFISILILTVIGVLGAAILMIAEKERKMVDSAKAQYDTFYAAEDCVDQGMYWLEKQNVMGKLPLALLDTEDYVTVHEGKMSVDVSDTATSSEIQCSYTVKERGIGAVVSGNDISEAYEYTNPDIGKQFYYEVESIGTDGKSSKTVVEANAIYGL